MILGARKALDCFDLVWGFSRADTDCKGLIDRKRVDSLQLIDGAWDKSSRIAPGASEGALNLTPSSPRRDSLNP